MRAYTLRGGLCGGDPRGSSMSDTPVRSVLLHSQRLLIAAAAVSLCATASPGVATAAERLPDSERPATWDMSTQELQAIGLGQYRGDPIPTPPEYQRFDRPAGPLPHGELPPPAIIFVNFDGETLTAGADSAQNNVTQIPGLEGVFAPYGEGAKRDAVIQAVVADWNAYNIIVVDERPDEGEYVMNMTGPTNPFGGGVLGIAPVDCWNQTTHSNITFAFHSVDDSFSPAVTATTIGQEVAHSFGLEHVDEPQDIMNPQNAGGDPSFIDECIVIVGGANCADQHMQFCPDGALAQNAHAELLAMFGAAVVDSEGPSVLITVPFDGMEYDSGTSYNVVAEVMDDSGIMSVQLLDNGAPVTTLIDEPWVFPIAAPRPGSHTYEVVAVDEHGNEGSSSPVTVTVIDEEGEDGDGTDSDSAGQDGGDKGCGCRGGAGDLGGGSLGVLAVLMLGWRRRRVA